MKKYTDHHTWVEVENGLATIGITNYAEKELGEVVYVELPKSDYRLSAGEEAIVIESTKAAIDIYSPVSGKVEKVNDLLKEHPGIINQSPEGEGWLFKMALENPQELDELLDFSSYQELISP